MDIDQSIQKVAGHLRKLFEDTNETFSDSTSAQRIHAVLTEGNSAKQHVDLWCALTWAGQRPGGEMEGKSGARRREREKGGGGG